MFGLKNYGGSCWLNSCLQSIFRIPEVIQKCESPENPVEESISKIWKSNGADGLRDLFEAIKNTQDPAYEMLAGRGLGDTNEALVYFCDKLKFLDDLCRFQVTEIIECTCGFSRRIDDSQIQFQLYPRPRQPITQAILDKVSPEKLEEWKCDQCAQRGTAHKKLSMKTFPKALVFKVMIDVPISLSQSLIINSQHYQLISCSLFNGGHWWTYGKDLGKPWVLYNDQIVRESSPQISQCKMLIYYRVN